MLDVGSRLMVRVPHFPGSPIEGSRDPLRRKALVKKHPTSNIHSCWVE